MKKETEHIQKKEGKQVIERAPQRERLVWHRPQLQQLQLSLDTAFSPGSTGDLVSASRP